MPTFYTPPFRHIAFSALLFFACAVGGLVSPTVRADPQAVRTLLEAARSGDQAKVWQLAEHLERRIKPSRGDRKTARALNKEALTLLRKGENALAVDRLLKAAQADKGDVEVMGNLGYALIRAQRLTDAKIVLEDALELAPTRASTWGNLGEVYGCLGDEGAAVAAFRLTYLFSRDRRRTRAYVTRLIDDPATPATLAAAASEARNGFQLIDKKSSLTTLARDATFSADRLASVAVGSINNDADDVASALELADKDAPYSQVTRSALTEPSTAPGDPKSSPLNGWLALAMLVLISILSGQKFSTRRQTRYHAILKRTSRRRRRLAHNGRLQSIYVVLGLCLAGGVIAIIAEGLVALVAARHPHLHAETMAAVTMVPIALLLYAWRRRRKRLRLNAEHLKDLLAMTPAQFEEAVQALLTENGYGRFRRTGKPGDLMADLDGCDRRGRRVIVQCKRYAPGTRIGSPAIQVFIGMLKVQHQADHGIFATTVEFSKPAIDLANQHGIELLDGVKLSALGTVH